MPTTIPRDPIAVKAARLAIGLMVLLLIISALPRPASTAAPVQAQAPAVPPIFVASTATPRPAPEPPPGDAPPALAAATALPAQPIASAPAGGASPAGSQLVTNADGSVSLPGSEAWMQPQANAAPAADSALQDAADAYKVLPVAVPPSAENQQPNYSKRPHTGR